MDESHEQNVEQKVHIRSVHITQFYQTRLGASMSCLGGKSGGITLECLEEAQRPPGTQDLLRACIWVQVTQVCSLHEQLLSFILLICTFLCMEVILS